MTYVIISLLTLAVMGYGVYVLFPQAMRSTGRRTKRWAYLFGVTLFAEFMLFVIAPVMGWWMPPYRSTYGGDVDLLFYIILVVTGVTFIAVSVVFVYCLFKYPADPARRAIYTHGDHKLEVLWTAIPAVMLFLLAIGQIPAWVKVKIQNLDDNSAAQSMQIEVTARQWEWRVRYPSPARMEDWRKSSGAAMNDVKHRLTPKPDDIRLVNEVHAVKNQRMLIYLKTQDVLHSFFLPHMRLKQDALPGKTILVWFEPTDANCEKVGDQWRDGRRYDEAKKAWVDDPGYVWELACAEYCGSRHSLMRGKLYVHETREDFDEWLKMAERNNRKTTPDGAAAPAAGQ